MTIVLLFFFHSGHFPSRSWGLSFFFHKLTVIVGTFHYIFLNWLSPSPLRVPTNGHRPEQMARVPVYFCCFRFGNIRLLHPCTSPHPCLPWPRSLVIKSKNEEIEDQSSRTFWSKKKRDKQRRHWWLRPEVTVGDDCLWMWMWMGMQAIWTSYVCVVCTLTMERGKKQRR